VEWSRAYHRRSSNGAADLLQSCSGKDDCTGRDASHCKFKCELDVAGEVFQGVQQGPESEVDVDFIMPGFSGDKAVSADAVFAGVNPGDICQVTEGYIIHVNASPGRPIR
jgi:hypothetical protein